MRDKTGKRGWPRLHLSTAVILFFTGSIALGTQFMHPTSYSQSIMYTHPPPHLHDAQFSGEEFGYPYEAFRSVNYSASQINTFEILPGGALKNFAILFVPQMLLAYLLERRIRRGSSLNPPADKV